MAGQTYERKAVLIAGSAFSLGLVAGLFLKDGAKHIYQRARATRWHRTYERAVTYDENLPDQLTRRELPGQPRYGGTGALGVSPTAARAPR